MKPCCSLLWHWMSIVAKNLALHCQSSFLSLTSQIRVTSPILRLPTDKLSFRFSFVMKNIVFYGADNCVSLTIEYDSIILGSQLVANTAPAIALAALRAVQQGEGPCIVDIGGRPILFLHPHCVQCGGR